VFNALDSLEAVDGARVLDLFAGTGALGIEALSRGAVSAVFVERDNTARRALESNLEVTDLRDRANVVSGDAPAYLRRTPARFDLVLLDPPYAYDDWDELLRDVAPVVSERGVVVLESDGTVELPPEWAVERDKRYGGTFVCIARPPEARAEPSEPR
jgi:16S rRNA (guanine966-N2)-methyltransferase